MERSTQVELAYRALALMPIHARSILWECIGGLQRETVSRTVEIRVPYPVTYQLRQVYHFYVSMSSGVACSAGLARTLVQVASVGRWRRAVQNPSKPVRCLLILPPHV